MKSQPTYKVCRRLGAGVYDKCQTQKYMLSEARHGKNKKDRRRNLSDFGKQLFEKQRVRFAYGVPERQLRRYIDEANRVSALGIEPGARLLEQLECRLDNVVYRLGFTRSRRAARQLVSHGHIEVNGVRTTIPSCEIHLNDVVAIRGRTQNLPVMERIKAQLETAVQPTWLSFDKQTFAGTVRALPSKENTEMVGNVGAILEFYSR